MAEQIKLENERKRQIDSLIRDIWGSWQELYTVIQQKTREYIDGGNEEEIGNNIFIRNILMDNKDKLSGKEFGMVRGAIKGLLNKIMKELKEEKKYTAREEEETGGEDDAPVNKDFSFKNLAGEAEKWQEEELKRSGGVNPNEI